MERLSLKQFHSYQLLLMSLLDDNNHYTEPLNSWRKRAHCDVGFLHVLVFHFLHELMVENLPGMLPSEDIMSFHQSFEVCFLNFCVYVVISGIVPNTTLKKAFAKISIGEAGVMCHTVGWKTIMIYESWFVTGACLWSGITFL